MQALLAAWKEACSSPTPSTVLIPKGTWSLKQAKLVGPNKAPIELKVEGILEAPLDPTQMPNTQGEWVTINYLDHFTLSGGGVFDGRGHEAWKRNDCHKNKNCVKLPLVRWLVPRLKSPAFRLKRSVFYVVFYARVHVSHFGFNNELISWIKNICSCKLRHSFDASHLNSNRKKKKITIPVLMLLFNESLGAYKNHREDTLFNKFF